ncbi:MAG: RNA pyrophosphohydrolase [Pseudomonadota bacterium]
MRPEEIEKLPYRPNVGIMLRNAQGMIFTAQRIDRPAGSEAWQMPQGGIDPGEEAPAAALRELQEETGILPDRVTIVAEHADWISYDLPKELLGKLWGGKWRGQTQKWFLMDFHGQDEEIDIFSHDQEFSEWRWSPLSEVVPNIVPFKREVYQAVIDGFAEHLR